MNNTSLEALENERKEFLINHGLSIESINEFKSKIQLTTQEEKNTLGKELFEMISKKGFNDNFERAIELIYKGANIEYKNEKKGDFSLLICARKNYLKTFLALIKAGANVNQVNNYLTTAVMAAARHGNEEMLKILILMGADINARCLDGDTAIMSAKRHDQTNCFNILMNHGAYLNNSNLANQTLMDIEGKIELEFNILESVLSQIIPDFQTQDPTSLIEEATQKLKKLTL